MNWNITVSALDSRVHHNRALSYQYFSLNSSVLRICGDQPVQMPSIVRRQPERVAQPLRGAGRWPHTTRWRRFRKDKFRQSPQRLGPARQLEECNVKEHIFVHIFAHIRTKCSLRGFTINCRPIMMDYRIHLQIDKTHVSFYKKL